MAKDSNNLRDVRGVEHKILPDRNSKWCHHCAVWMGINEDHECDVHLAMDIFNYNSTVAAKMALGEGIDRETVAACLRSLADAIETQDCAEDMSPIYDRTLSQLHG
jgi:hypothetical protein